MNAAEKIKAEGGTERGATQLQKRQCRFTYVSGKRQQKCDQIILGKCLCNQEITYVKYKTKPEKAKP